MSLLLNNFAEAIENGNSKTVHSLISSGSVDANARLTWRNGRQCPPLARAVCLAQTKIVDILLRANARIDDTDEFGCTACHFAAVSSCVGALTLLLAHRPNLAHKDSDGRTALYYSFKNFNNERSSLMLIKAGAPLDGISRADLCRFAATSTAAIQALLDRDVVVSELRDDNDATPLHLAVVARNRAVLSMLIKVAGVDLEARNSLGTCTHIAARLHQSDALRLFVDAGADVNSADNEGWTPLHWAVDSINCESAVFLLAAGADVHARGVNGRMAVHNVVNLPDRIALHLAIPLLAGGADPDGADQHGDTLRLIFARRALAVDAALVDAARREIAKLRLDFVRSRALQVCIGLEPLGLDAFSKMAADFHSGFAKALCMCSRRPTTTTKRAAKLAAWPGRPQLHCSNEA
jgi:ankyrin repeat protein